ncbi:MAG: flagellar hook-basal body complex protein, partial [Deltaproteobacteria bacterium]
IDARYNDGRVRTVGRVALASFTSEVNLTRMGGTLFQQTPLSGEAAIGFAGAGGRGSLQGSALESSNVDLSTEFVNLITDQRAYQATSRTITTADELLVETVNLKR